jgi:SAM-dependent methyltransferase
VYRPMAAALVAAAPVPLEGSLVADVGSGTGAVAQAAQACGARVVGADRSRQMLAFHRSRRGPAVTADAFDLPFRRDAFDIACAGFLLNHLPPAPVLAELARITRPGGAVLASTWAAGEPDPVKSAIDAVLTSWGWVPPAWYRTLKEEVEPLSGAPEPFAAAAEGVGLSDVHASVGRIDLSLPDPGAAVAYRLAMPHIAPWAAAQCRSVRTTLTRQALAKIAPLVDGWRPAVILLTARVGSEAGHGDSSRRAAARSRASR